MARKPKIIFEVLSLMIMSACANQLPPGGGEIDKLAPEIIESFPVNGTTNYQENFFEITFSEYVDRRSVQDAIFISPPILKGLDYDWSGKTLSVYFNDSVKSNTTYTVVIGTDVLDINNRNKMSEPYTFAFSTGNQIDIGKISGTIYNDDPTGTLVFAYHKNHNDSDPIEKKPDYISQVGKNGKYTLLGLGNDDYNLFAIRDKFRDLKYQRNEDEFGVQFKDVAITDSTKEIENVDFFLTEEDTIPPSINNIYMKDINHLLVEFNEPIDSTKIFKSNFYIYDSTASVRKEIKYFFKGDSRANQFLISLSDSLIEQNNYFLVSENICDKSGNINKYDASQFTLKTAADTLYPKVIKIEGTLPEAKVDYDLPIISVKFDDGFDNTVIDTSITIEDNKENIIDFRIKNIDDASFDIFINSKLKQKSDYTIKINLKNFVDAAGNFIDSVYQKKITTANELDFSGVSGIVDNSIEPSNIVMKLKNVQTDKNDYELKLDTNYEFNFTKIIPGKYLLWGFYDENKNGVYDFGKVKPYKKSEKFVFHPDTLNLRARWPVGDIKFKNPKN